MDFEYCFGFCCLSRCYDQDKNLKIALKKSFSPVNATIRGHEDSKAQVDTDRHFKAAVKEVCFVLSCKFFFLVVLSI